MASATHRFMGSRKSERPREPQPLPRTPGAVCVPAPSSAAKSADYYPLIASSFSPSAPSPCLLLRQDPARTVCSTSDDSNSIGLIARRYPGFTAALKSSI